MTPAALKEHRVQKVLTLVEGILDEIAREYASPLTMAPAMVEFMGALQMRLVKIGNARLGALLRRKGRSDD